MVLTMKENNILSTENLVKALVWLVPILFAMGLFYGQTKDAAATVAEVQKNFREHEKLSSHPVGAEKLNDLEKQNTMLLHEQKMMRKQMRRAAENISAICQATKANCK